MVSIAMNDSVFSSFQDNLELLGSLGDEAKAQAKTLLSGQLHQLDLVTREEYDAVVATLERALERVDALEKKLDASNT